MSKTCPDCGGALAYLTHHPEEDPDVAAPQIVWGVHRPDFGCVDPVEEAYRLGFRAGWRRSEEVRGGRVEARA